MHTVENASRTGGKVFGFPLQGFSLFQGLLLSFAAALLTFCGTTMVAIFTLLFWNYIGGHHVDFANTYLYVGLPSSLIVLAVALPVFLTLWIRAKIRR